MSLSAQTVVDPGRAALGVSQSMEADRNRRTSLELQCQPPDGGPFDDDEIARYATSAELRRIEIDRCAR
jgi:hypothetical protein